MPSKELFEKVARDIGLGIYEDTPPNVMAKELLSTIHAALQEPTEGMFEAGHETLYEGDYDATMNFALEPAWRAMLNASALGEQSE